MQHEGPSLHRQILSRPVRTLPPEERFIVNHMNSLLEGFSMNFSTVQYSLSLALQSILLNWYTDKKGLLKLLGYSIKHFRVLLELGIPWIPQSVDIHPCSDLNLNID